MNPKTKIKRISLILVVILVSQIFVPIIGEINESYAITTENGSYEYKILRDGTVEISKYIGTDTLVIIPDTINEKRVTSIGNWCFSNCNNIKDIKIPNTVTNIGMAAFAKCSSLVSVNIPEGVTTIEQQLFDGCSSLIKIEIPKGVTEIKSYAFLECTSLETVEIPDSVETISTRVFQHCQKLKNINIPEMLYVLMNCFLTQYYKFGQQ